MNASFPYTPGYEEDGFLKRFKIKAEDIEFKADGCTKVPNIYSITDEIFWFFLALETCGDFFDNNYILSCFRYTCGIQKQNQTLLRKEIF